LFIAATATSTDKTLFQTILSELQQERITQQHCNPGTCEPLSQQQHERRHHFSNASIVPWLSFLFKPIAAAAVADAAAADAADGKGSQQPLHARQHDQPCRLQAQPVQ
jgi:hypothetical protein